MFDIVIYTVLNLVKYTTQKMKFSIKDFFSKCDPIRSFLRMWSRLLKKSLMENLIFCVMRPKKILLPEMRVKKKNFTRAAEKKTLFDKFNWIFSINFTLKKLL